MDNCAYWFNTETGQLLEVAQQFHSHIKAVIASPESFSLTTEFIEELYQVFDEPLGYEGFAREEIVKVILRETAWVRIRHYTGHNDYWSVNVGAKANKNEAETLLEKIAPQKFGHRILWSFFEERLV